jgi:hypothetical protein
MGYYDVVAADSPAAWWPMDDASTAGLRELVAGRTAAAVGTGHVARQGGLPFKGAKTVGTYGWQFTPDTAMLGASYSIECWAIFDQFVNADFSEILGISGSADWRRFLRVGRGTTTTAQMEAAQASAGVGTDFESAIVLATATPYHLVTTYTGTTGKHYVNGVEVYSGTVSNSTPTDVTGQNGWLLGGWAGTNSFWPAYGTFAHVASYNAALSAAQVARHFVEGRREGVSY